MSVLNISNYVVTIPAGSELSVVTHGTRLRCLSATGAFRLGLESEATFPFEGGMAIALPAGAEFKLVRLVNTSGAPVTVEIVVSFGDFLDDRSTFAGTLNAAIVSMPAIMIAAGQSVNIGTMPAVAIAGTPAVAIPAPTQTAAVPDTTVTTTPATVATGGSTVRGYSVRNVGSVSCRLASSTAGLGVNTGLLLRAGEAAWLGTSANLAAVTVAGSTKLSIMVLLV